MHICYVDDSGDSRSGVMLTALIIEEGAWTSVLAAWLAGRRTLHHDFGVGKNSELHANDLYKGRREFCETPRQNARFGASQRAAAGRIMLSALSKHSSFTLFTVGTSERATPRAYARLIAFLEDWAARRDTYLIVFYDGQQGTDEEGTLSPTERQNRWESAMRSAAPYRTVHRDLNITTRRIVEDVVMVDSKYSQLIQATDLLAYGAYQAHRQAHPEIWGTAHAAEPASIRAYMQSAAHWPEDSDRGVYWLE